MLFGQLIPTVDAYYCDSVNGSDSNAGTYAAPFLSIAHMASVDAGANKARWRLVSGSTWREQLTVPRASMTVDAYGPGAAPLLDCSDLISSGAWSKTAGQTNVYQATLTVPSNDVPSAPDWYTSVWEAGTRYPIAHSIAAVDATAGSYYPVSVNSTTITLYVHTSDGSSPAAKTIEYAARMAGVYAQSVDHVSLMGLRTRRNINANGSIICGKYATLTNCTAEEGNKHNIFFDAGSILQNCATLGSYYESLGTTQYIGFGTADPTLGFDFINCTAANMGLSDTTPPGFFIHSSVLGATFAHATFRGCTGNIAFSACATVIVDTCTSSNGLAAYDATSLTVKDSGITFNSSDGYGISAPNVACAITLSGSTFTGPVKSNLGGTCINLGVSGCSLTATNCTFQTATNVLNAIGAAIISIQNCTIDVYHYGYTDYTATPSFSVDHNTYNGYNPTEFSKLSGVDKTYAQWKALGQDAHSTP